MDIEEFTADDAAVVEEVVALSNAVDRHDAPWSHPTTVTRTAGLLRHGWSGETPRAFVARDSDGRGVGCTELWLGKWDNLDLGWLWLTVHPDERRRGVGSALMDAMVKLSRELGHTKLGVDGWDDPSTYAFAEAHGFSKKSQAINRRQLVSELDLGIVQKLYDEAAAVATDYELLRIAGRTPEALIDDVAVLTAAINDAPLDDLEIEDEEFPPERIRAYEEAAIGRGNRLYRMVARHRVTGELAGHTIVAVEVERPAIGDQHDTSVVREHRGHRLGLLLKAGMNLWLAEAEPQLETIDTWNAESNDHMIAVNELLGYQVLGRGLEFQRTL